MPLHNLFALTNIYSYYINNRDVEHFFRHYVPKKEVVVVYALMRTILVDELTRKQCDNHIRNCN